MAYAGNRVIIVYCYYQVESTYCKQITIKTPFVMKEKLYLFLSAMLLAAQAVLAQNAQQLYFNQLSVDYDYQAASFVVDTPPPTSPLKRAFLLWSKNYTKDPSTRGLSLDQFDPGGNFLSEQINLQPGAATEYLLPKKIIKAKLVKGYYLLGYVIKSSKLINGIPVYSTPLVIRLDENLNPIWINRIHFATLTTANAQALIEYNDIIEASNGDLVLAGRFSDTPTGQTRVLMTRLNNGGALLWTYQYFLNTCNSEAFSLTEATNRNIALTGYIEECPATSFSGPRRLLYATFSAAGIPVVIEKLSAGTQALSGARIVKHTNIVNSDEFFITGYIDILMSTGAINKQILLVDIKESGGPITVNHIGDGGPEAANDLVFTNLGGNNYYLYLTGYTGSYYTNVKTEVFFLFLKYSANVVSLAEFSTFPSLSSSYVARRGLEIRSAGKERFAILANADFTITPQQRTFTHVHIRDLTDGSGNCIKQHNPPVTRYQLSIATVGVNFPRLIFNAYRDEFIPLNKVFPRLECGTFFIDPYAASVSPVLPALAKLQAPPAGTEVSLRVYPNPVRDQLYVDFGASAASGITTASIYTPDMRLVRELRLSGSNRGNISLGGLHNGLYFVQIRHNGVTKIFQIMKE